MAMSSDERRARARKRARKRRAVNPAQDRAYNKAWRDAHLEQRKANQREWYAQNKDQVLARRDPEAIAAAQRERYAQDPEKFRARAREWRTNNLDKARASNRNWMRIWAANNPEEKRERALRYDYRACNAPGYATAEQIAARVAYFGGVCSYCGGPYEHLEHAISLSQGGTNWPANLRPSCEACNLTKGKRTIFEFLRSH
jgi:5-methylcytosine-specific restriction endonuclease McrA